MSDDDAGDDARVASRTAWLRRAIYVVVALGVLAFLLQGADGPADPVLAPARGASPETGASPAAGAPPASTTLPADGLGGCTRPDRAQVAPIEGFGQIPFQVLSQDGSTAFDGCAHLAATPETRAQGLMAQQDLAGYDAMVFRFDQPGTGAFYMFRTVLPLSIAYLGADGALVSSTDMDPCPEADASACPTFPPAGPYLHAIEVVRGDLGRLGIVPGATVTFGEPRP